VLSPWIVPSNAAAQMPTGRWRLNVEKSKFDPGPGAKSDVRTFEDRGDGVVLFAQEGINAQGNPFYNSYAFKYDGKEWPTGYNVTTRAKTTQTYRIIDPFTTEWTARVNGQVTTVTRRVVSKDGRTAVYETKGKNLQGRTINNHLVFEKE
jgi:hypothetical protein